MKLRIVFSVDDKTFMVRETDLTGHVTRFWDWIQAVQKDLGKVTWQDLKYMEGSDADAH